MSMDERLNGAALNTDVPLYEGEGFQVYRTQDGQGIGICSNGRCVVKPAKAWVDAVWTDTMLQKVDRLQAALTDPACNGTGKATACKYGCVDGMVLMAPQSGDNYERPCPDHGHGKREDKP